MADKTSILESIVIPGTVSRQACIHTYTHTHLSRSAVCGKAASWVALKLKTTAQLSHAKLRQLTLLLTHINASYSRYTEWFLTLMTLHVVVNYIVIHTAMMTDILFQWSTNRPDHWAKLCRISSFQYRKLSSSSHGLIKNNSILAHKFTTWS